MAEKVIYKFPLIYEILTRSCDYCYSDKAISLLNQLNKRTQKMCFENFHTLLSGKFMKKRVVTLKSKDQKNLKDPRLAYFKIKIIMSKDFDSNLLKKFVKFFDDLKDEAYWLTNDFNQLNLSHKLVTSKTNNKLKLVNIDELKNAKLLNIHFIKQNISAPLSISFFWEVLKEHEKDLVHWALDKVQIVKGNIIDSIDGRGFDYQFDIKNELWISRMTKLLLNGSKNSNFVPIIDYLYVAIINANDFIPKIESKIIALKIWSSQAYMNNRMRIQGRGNIQSDDLNQNDLAIWMRAIAAYRKFHLCIIISQIKFYII